jgi:hypothetical protein
VNGISQNCNKYGYSTPALPPMCHYGWALVPLSLQATCP